MLPDGPPSKRSVLSVIARCYDPLGLIAPILVKAKIFLQALWKENLSWDDPLPGTMSSVWIELASQLRTVQNIKLHRFSMMPNASVQVHAFSDASITAYGACIYLRAEAFGSVTSYLLCSKSKVAPLKTLTIDKLELSDALLLTELIYVIKHIFAFDFHCWSDSTIVFYLFIYFYILALQVHTYNYRASHIELIFYIIIIFKL